MSSHSETRDDAEAVANNVVNMAVASWKPPGSAFGPTGSINGINNVHHPQHLLAPSEDTEWVRNHDGSILLDHNGIPLSVARLLATKPLRHELSSRPGPGNRKLTYLSGEAVTRTLNDAFGFDGWNLEIITTTREHMAEMSDGRVAVAYTARVRLTHRKSGTYKEDCGAGDATDRTAGTAIANALKASITDAMKRAARHFGDKLGNSLYQGTFSINKAPNTLQQALDQYAIDRANHKFGVPTNQTWRTPQQGSPVIVKKAAPLATTKTELGNPTKEVAPMQNVYRKSDPIKPIVPIPNARPPTQNVYQKKTITPPIPGPQPRTSINVTILPAPIRTAASTSVPAKSASMQTPVQPIHTKPIIPASTPAQAMSTIPMVTPGAMHPPPTPGQRLLESNLFGLNTNLEDQPPISKVNINRPATSTGLHQQPKQLSDSGGGPFAGKKRTNDAIPSHEDRQIKRPTALPAHRVINPYA